ncbi:heat shock transcription [Galdieria sulphuraria]|uniref:Heat shock transcription n=1 Tax=Galdieria sulphuraria TaxID=130081 RepID=M2X3F4_GALSU|nr:heat shock transcription [Galdieria sulphuraria]EME30925.1 heat shock transcription [Galdieria sulphuraria]|eukprot:XP_005707445.1 heat shock transcription [Galdieria sulphuraria]
MKDSPSYQETGKFSSELSRTHIEDKPQSLLSTKESIECENKGSKRDLEYVLESLEGLKKRYRDSASEPLSRQTILSDKDTYPSSKARTWFAMTGSSPNNAVAPFRETCNNLGTQNSATILANNASRTAPFDMTLTSEPAKIEKVLNHSESPLQEVPYPPFYFPAMLKNAEQADTEIHLKLASSSPVETAIQSNSLPHWSWTDFRYTGNAIPNMNSNHFNRTQDGYRSNLPIQHSAHILGSNFQNSMQTYAYPVILQYPFPYVFPHNSEFANLSKENVKHIPFRTESDTQNYHQMDPEISKTAALSYSVEDKNADLWKQGTHSESRPIISMVSSDSLKTAGNQQVKLEVNEERFAAISSPFLRKLLSIVEEKDIEHLCCWTKSGRSFVVWHPIRFENEVLPRYYKHSNFSSFVRQLNQYGFHKLHPEAWEFGHPLFVRNRIDLIVRICRRPSRRLKKQTDAHQVDSLVEEVTNHNLSQCEENGKALSNAISSAMSINDNEETILEAMESLDNVQWSQEEEEEEEEEDDDDDNNNNNNNNNNKRRIE